MNSGVYAAVDIHTASQAELEVLEGIGPATAKAIVEYRNEHGLFSSVDDLKKMSEIGAGTLKQIRNDLTVDKEEKMAVEQKKESNP